MDAEAVDLNLDQMMARGREIRDQIELIQEDLKKLTEEKDALDASIMERMEEQGITRTGNDFANVSISTTEFANVEDWDALYSFVKEHDAFHLLQRRVASKAALEYKVAGEELPGITFAEKTTLNFRRKN